MLKFHKGFQFCKVFDVSTYNTLEWFQWFTLRSVCAIINAPLTFNRLLFIPLGGQNIVNILKINITFKYIVFILGPIAYLSLARLYTDLLCPWRVHYNSCKLASLLFGKDLKVDLKTKQYTFVWKWQGTRNIVPS